MASASGSSCSPPLPPPPQPLPSRLCPKARAVERIFRARHGTAQGGTAQHPEPRHGWHDQSPSVAKVGASSEEALPKPNVLHCLLSKIKDWPEAAASSPKTRRCQAFQKPTPNLFSRWGTFLKRGTFFEKGNIFEKGEHVRKGTHL